MGEPVGPTSRHPSPTDPSAFQNPWADGVLIRYLAWLRQAHAGVPLPKPAGARLPGPGVPLNEVFVQPRLSPTGGRQHSLDLFDVLDRQRHVAILGAPGSGRSTLLAALVHGLTDPSANPVLDRLGRMVPILLPVRALALDGSIRTFPAMLECLDELPFWGPGMAQRLPALAARGQALFVLDDLDHPLDPGVQEALREAVLDGIWRYPLSTWVVTAEPAPYAALPLRIEGVDARRVPHALRSLLDGRTLHVPTWHLEPFGAEQIRGYAHRWLALTQVDPADVAESVEDFEDALSDAPLATALAPNPGMLALLCIVYAARGDLPPDRSTLIDWLVAAWAATLDDAPGADAIPTGARRAWIEALARAAEAARAAAARRGAPATLAPHREPATPPVSLSHATKLLRRSLRSTGHPDPGQTEAGRFVHAVAVRPGVLVGRADGLSFANAEHQRFLAALHLAADLGADASAATESALATLRSWSSSPTAKEDLLELFGIIGGSGDLIERVGRRILGRADHKSLDELAELAPIALALDEGQHPVPDALREAARELVDETVERWATERQAVPPWTRDLTPVASHPELDRLDLSGCTSVEDLTPLQSLPRLQRLDMRGCAKVTDLRPLEHLDALQWADLRDCSGVDDLEPLGRLPALRWLDLGGCTTLTDLSSLANLDTLQALVLHGCTGLSDLAPLGAARSLRYLVITDCTGITDLHPLAVLPGGGTVWVKGSGVRYAPRDLRWQVIGLRE